MKTITVSKTKDSAFRSIQEALSSDIAASDEALTIEIDPGVYCEKIEVHRSNIVLRGMGSSPSETECTFSDCANALMPDGSKRGTFRSYSMFLDGNDITVQNLTISNTSGDEHTAGQALALYADGDRMILDNCILRSRQDTLFTGPLPPKELQPGGFIGPKQFAPRINCRQFYKNCTIEGNVDFIFGSATAYFDNCTIVSLHHSEEPGATQGYVTAPSTPEGRSYGYVFYNCQFLSSECPDNSCYLSRPWRDYAKVVCINCIMGPHIKDEGFHDWNKPAARNNMLSATANCKRPDGTDFLPGADFAKSIPPEVLPSYRIEEVFRGKDFGGAPSGEETSWNPLHE